MAIKPIEYSRIEYAVASLAEAGQKPRRGKAPIPDAQPAGGAIGESIGEGRATSAQASQGGGIASPLTEPDVGRRVYHPAQEIYTADGTLVKVHPVKTIYMQDANGNEVVMHYGLPAYASITP